MNIIAPNNPGLTVSQHGLLISRQLSYEEWIEMLEQAKHAKSSYLNILSDITSYGRRCFGDDRVNEAIEQLEFDLSDATKAEVISRVGLEQRTTHNLSSEHAYIIGKFVETDADREKWSGLCNEYSLTAHELKKSIEKGEVIRADEISEKSGHTEGISTVQAVHFSFLKWQRQFKDPKEILKLPKGEREKILKQLTPIIQLAADIESSIN